MSVERRRLAISNSSVCTTDDDNDNTVWTAGVANPNSSDDTYLWNPAADVYYPVDYANFYYGQQQQQQEEEQQQRSSSGTLSRGPVCISLLQKYDSQWNGASCAQQICGLCELHKPEPMNEDELINQQVDADRQQMDEQQANQQMYEVGLL